MSSERAACSYTIRACGASDEGAILELLRPTLGERAVSRQSAEQWRWKHDLSPFGPSYCVGAVNATTGTLIGLRALMWWTFVSPGGSVIRAVRAVDTATHADYQRRGIFSTLTAQAVVALRTEHASFVFNTPNDNSLPGYLKMGWKVAARWTPHVRPVRPLRALLSGLAGRLGKERGASPASIAESGLTAWSDFRHAGADEIAAVVTAHEARRVQVGLRTCRNLPYLDWRYGAQPHAEYGVHALRSREGLGGFVIARLAVGAFGLRVLVVTEMFLRDPSLRSARALLRSVLKGVRCHYLLAFFSPGTIEHQALRRRGFVAARGRSFTWAVRPLHECQMDPTLPASWDLTLGEMEVF